MRYINVQLLLLTIVFQSDESIRRIDGMRMKANISWSVHSTPFN